VEDITNMIKSVISYLQIVFLGLFVIGCFSYLMLPKISQLDGKCFYYPSVSMDAEFKRGDLFYLEVISSDLIRYQVHYYQIRFNKDFVITKKDTKGRGSLNYLFSQKGYLEMNCPKSVDTLLNFK